MPTQAKESPSVAKARAKLRIRFAEEEQRISSEALKEVGAALQQVLKRRAADTQLRKRTVSLFDENQHPAKPQNRFVQRLIKELRQIPKGTKRHSPLSGRIKAKTDDSG